MQRPPHHVNFSKIKQALAPSCSHPSRGPLELVAVFDACNDESYGVAQASNFRSGAATSQCSKGLNDTDLMIKRSPAKPAKGGGGPLPRGVAQVRCRRRRGWGGVHGGQRVGPACVGHGKRIPLLTHPPPHAKVWPPFLPNRECSFPSSPRTPRRTPCPHRGSGCG